MKFIDEFENINTIFLDTAPIIYYIEAHFQFGPLMNEIIQALQLDRLIAFTSVITIAEVLPKPVELGKKKLTRMFMDFLKHGKNMNLLDISADIAEKAGIIRGHYTNIKTMDAIQISSALSIEADLFLTNDIKLKQVKEIKILVLKDFL